MTLPLVALINHILTCRIHMWSDPHVDGQSPWILLCRAGKWYDPVWNRSNAEAEKAEVDSKTSQITTAQNRSDATPVVVSQMEIAQTLCL